MAKYIFLDIDGVLNSEHTLDQTSEHDASIISDQYLKNLKHIVEETDAKLVLSSSWRVYFNGDIKNPNNIFAMILLASLNKHNLKLHDMTPFIKGQFSNERGLEIKTYIDQHNITDYVVIDDEKFSDFKKHLDISKFVQTTFGDETTTIETEGLNKKVAKKAIEILNKGTHKMTLIERMDKLIKKLESNDPHFIEKFNKDFDEFEKKYDNEKGKQND